MTFGGITVSGNESLAIDTSHECVMGLIKVAVCRNEYGKKTVKQGMGALG